VTEVRLAPVGFVARLVQIAFRDDPKRPNGGECAAVVPVEFVAMVAIEHDLALRSARELEASDERVPRIAVSVGAIALSVARVVVSVTRIVPIAIVFGVLADVDPRHLDITNIGVAIAWIEIHRPIIGTSGIACNSRSDWFGAFRLGYGGVVGHRVLRVELCSSPSTLCAALRPRVRAAFGR
jgi:hypothetical protein